MTPLYRNTRALRVRFLQILFWTTTFGFAALALFGRQNGPNSESWIVGAILAPLFALFALGMEWYLRCYVTALDAKAGWLVLETLSTFGRARSTVAWADVEFAGERRDVMDDVEGPSVDNTASLLRVRGRPLLIVDTTGDSLDSAGLQRILSGARQS